MKALLLLSYCINHFAVCFVHFSLVGLYVYHCDRMLTIRMAEPLSYDIYREAELIGESAP